MKLAALSFVAFVFLACSSSSTAPGGGGASAGGGGGGAPIALGASENGIITYYTTADGTGACTFDASPNDLDIAAMNIQEWNGSAVCGECIAITGPKGNVTVRVVDECPDCVSGQLDLSQSAFAKVADVSAGRVNVTWQAVSCAVTGNVAYHYKDGSSQYWTAIQIRNSKLPIAKLEVKTNGNFQEIARVDYNYFVADQGTGPGSVDVRITAVDGQTIEDTLAPPTSNVTVDGASQFQ
jgi:expansin (peptidoglycan-binding protein)